MSLSLSLSHGDVCSVCMHTSFLFRESFCFRFGRAQVVTARIFLEIWAKFIELSHRNLGRPVAKLWPGATRQAAGAGARAGEEPARSILSNLYMPQVVVGMWPRRVASLCGLSVRVLHELSVRFRVLIISSPVQSE